MLHGVEVTHLDVMDHGVELPGRAQRGVCVAVYVVKKLDAVDHSVELGATDHGIELDAADHGVDL